MTSRQRQHDENERFLRWSETRAGGVYIAVLGTSLIVALLSIAALTQQRIQNRTLTASDDIRQAQLNANTAVELALLTMKQSANWRAAQPHGEWFTDRNTGAGSCTVIVTDPVDSSLANSPDDPVLLQGIGYCGQAVQRVEITVDPRKEPLGCLRSAVAAGDLISLSGDTLRSNGFVTANQISASSSQVFGEVEAASISGSTYNGTTTQIQAAKLPAMPDWSTVFDHYRSGLATELVAANLPTVAPNLAKNFSIESGTAFWTGSPPGVATADIDDSNNQVHTGNRSLRVRNRSSYLAGASQMIDSFVEPNKQYYIEAWVYLPLLSSRNFRITLYTKGTGSALQVASGPDTPVSSLLGGWRQVAATLTAPSWSGALEYAFVKIAGSDSSNTSDFYLDDIIIREPINGMLIYRRVLGPGVNTLYSGAPTNPQGLYWINCNGNRLVITRSRIRGTLLVVNPGADSCIFEGPISWSPATAGYPALLVDATNSADADFGLYANNRGLSEAENGVNFNPIGAPHEQFGQDSDTNDIYPSCIQGLVVIRDDLTYSNRTLISGQIVVGDDINNSSGELEIDYQPESLLNPPPGFLAPYSYPRRPASARKIVQ